MFRDGIKVTGAVVVVAAITIVALILVASMAIFGFGLFNRATADFRGQTEAIENVQADGDFRIQAYDHFFDLCSAIQADENRINIIEQELEQELTDKRRGELQITLTAVKSSRGEKVAQYNADASKDFTVGQFRDNNLPYEIDMDNTNTRCN